MSPRPAIQLVVALLLLAGPWYFVAGGGWNQNSRLALTRAIVERGTLSIDGFAGGTQDVAGGVDGRRYTDKSPGPSWLAVPVYAALRALPLGAGSYATRVDRIAHWTAVVLCGGATVAAGLALLGLLWRGLELAPRWSLALTLGWGLGTMALPYAGMLMNHQLAASLSLLGFALVAAPGLAGWDGEPRPGRWLLAGHLLGWAAVCDYACLATCLACGVLLLARERRLGPPLLLIAGWLPPVAGFMAYNAACFGGPLTLGYQHELRGVWKDLAGHNVGFSAPSLAKLYQVTLGRYRGLLWGSPFLALAPFGLAAGLRVPRWRPTLLASAAVVAAFLTYNASFVYWHAGYAAGPRFLVPALPFIVLLIAPLRAGRPLALALIALSIALMLATTAVDPQVPGGHHDDTGGSLAHRGRPPQHYPDPWFQYTLPNALDGRFGVNRQGHLDPLQRPGGDPAGDAASFNAGGQLGLDGRAQLLPLLLLWAVAGAWLVSATRGSADRGSAASTTRSAAASP